METVRFSSISKKYMEYISNDSKSIYEAYKNPSEAKRNAWKYCQMMCDTYNGYGLSVIGNNNFVFSAGFRFIDDNNNEHFVYITPSYDREAIVDTKEIY